MQQGLANTIRQIRIRVQNYGDYLSSVDETRTRYTLIDPVLRSLGWDLSDPAQVRVEIDINVSTAVKKVDYALYKSGSGGRPWILVEAKRLAPEQIERFTNMMSLRRKELADNWGALTTMSTSGDTSWSEFNSRSAEERISSHELHWTQLSRGDRIRQLSEYVGEFGMVAGYGVLTDGDEWSIYDIGQEGVFPEKPTKVVRVLSLDDSIDDCTEALNLLLR